MPRGSEKTDWEVELGVVIGAAAKYVDEADALSHVVGLSIEKLGGQRQVVRAD